MKVIGNKVIGSIIVVLIGAFVGLSFLDFYTITTVGSVLDPITGDFFRYEEATGNNMVSVVFALLSLIGVFNKKRVLNILAILISVINILLIVIVEPMLVSFSSLIGSAHFASLTIIGWIAVMIILLVTLLLIYRDFQIRIQSEGN